MRVDLTDEWKDWIECKTTRPDLPRRPAWTLPVYNQLPGELGEWMVWHPWTDTYMVVPHKLYLEYRAEMDRRGNPQ